MSHWSSEIGSGAYFLPMTSTDPWHSLASELATITGPALADGEAADLRAAVERCALLAHTDGLAPEALIKRLKDAFAESALRVSRETYLSADGRDHDDRLISKMISWGLTRYFNEA